MAEDHNPEQSEEKSVAKAEQSETKSSGRAGQFLHSLLDGAALWFSNPQKRKLTLKVIAIVIGLILLWMIVPGDKSIEVLKNVGEKIGYPGFYIGQALLPLLGFPIIPFLVIGSLTFNFWGVLLGTAIAQSIQIGLAYVIGRKFLKGTVKNLSEWFEFPMFKLKSMDQVKFIFFIKLIPGLSQTLRHYILAIYDVPFKPYYLISWSMSMVFSIGVILVCKTFRSSGNWNIYLGVVFVVVVAVVIFLLRKQKDKKQSEDLD